MVNTNSARQEIIDCFLKREITVTQLAALLAASDVALAKVAQIQNKEAYHE